MKGVNLTRGVSSAGGRGMLKLMSYGSLYVAFTVVRSVGLYELINAM